MPSIAIAAGTSRRSEFRAGAFEVSEVEFVGGRTLVWHEHPRARVAVVVDGVVRKRFLRRVEDAVQGTAVSMPPVEPHEDVFWPRRRAAGRCRSR